MKKSKIKQFISLLIEELLLASYLIWVYTHSLHLKVNPNPIFGLGIVFGICIVIAKIVDSYVKRNILIEDSDVPRLKRLIHILGRWALISSVFLIGAIAMNLVPIIDSDAWGILIIAACAGFCHMGISYFIELIVISKQDFMDMFTDDVIYDEDMFIRENLKPEEEWHLAVVEHREMKAEFDFVYEKAYFIRGERDEHGDSDGFYFAKVDDNHAEIRVAQKAEAHDMSDEIVLLIEKAEGSLNIREDNQWGEIVAKFSENEDEYVYELKGIPFEEDPIDGGAHTLVVHLDDDNNYVFTELRGIEFSRIYDAMYYKDKKELSPEEAKKLKHIEIIAMKMTPLTTDNEIDILTAAFPLLVKMNNKEL